MSGNRIRLNCVWYLGILKDDKLFQMKQQIVGFGAGFVIMGHKNRRRMITKIAALMQKYHRIDQAILCLRIFIGAILAMHVIGKMQRYNVMINGYPPLLFNDPVLTFVIFNMIEAACAVMIVIGFWTRFAAFLMALGMFVDIFIVFPALGWFGVERQVLYMGYYIFLIIAGGGKFALDARFFGKRGKE